MALCGSVIGYKPKQLVSNTPSTRQNPFQNKGDAEECGAKMVKDSRDLNQPHSPAKPRVRMMPTFLLWEWTHVLFSPPDLRLASAFQLNKVLLNILIRKEMTVYTIDKDSLKVSWLDMVKLEFKSMIFFLPTPGYLRALGTTVGSRRLKSQTPFLPLTLERYHLSWVSFFSSVKQGDWER